MNSGNLISATAGYPSSELSRSRESGDHPPEHAHWSVSQSVRQSGIQGGQRGPTPAPHPSGVRGTLAQHRARIRQGKTRRAAGTTPYAQSGNGVRAQSTTPMALNEVAGTRRGAAGAAATACASCPAWHAPPPSTLRARPAGPVDFGLVNRQPVVENLQH
jgi:hypothetical protein